MSCYLNPCSREITYTVLECRPMRPRLDPKLWLVRAVEMMVSRPKYMAKRMEQFQENRREL